MSERQDGMKLGFISSVNIPIMKHLVGKTVLHVRSNEPKTDSQVIHTQALPWLDPAEKARGEIGIAINTGLFSDRDFIINSSTTVNIEQSGPLITESFRITDAEIETYFDRLCSRLIGRGDRTSLRGEMDSGYAVYDRLHNRGLLTSIKIPFIFSAFATPNEVGLYLRLLSRMLKQEVELDKKFRENPNANIDFKMEATSMAISASSDFKMSEDTTSQILTHEELDGLAMSQAYSGGIHLAPLIAMGKVQSINGVQINRIDPKELGRYILISRESNGRIPLELIEILERGETMHEVLYEQANWKRIYLEGRKQTYPLFNFYLNEKENLTKSAKEIWNDNSIPPKIKRQLLLMIHGIEINPHLHIPLETFLRDANKIIPELWDMWQMGVGLSTALYNESALAKTPTARFNYGMRENDIRAASGQLRKKLTDPKLLKISPLDSRDYVIVYPSVWDETTRIVGGVWRFDALPQLAGELDTSNWGMELQLGRYPRIIEKSAGHYVRREHQPAKPIVPGLVDPTQSTIIDRITSGPEVDNNSFLQMVEQEALRAVQSFSVKLAAREIMLLTDQSPLAIEWHYFQPLGKIFAMDFHGGKRLPTTKKAD